MHSQLRWFHGILPFPWSVVTLFIVGHDIGIFWDIICLVWWHQQALQLLLQPPSLLGCLTGCVKGQLWNGTVVQPWIKLLWKALCEKGLQETLLDVSTSPILLGLTVLGALFKLRSLPLICPWAVFLGILCLDVYLLDLDLDLLIWFPGLTRDQPHPYGLAWWLLICEWPSLRLPCSPCSGAVGLSPCSPDAGCCLPYHHHWFLAPCPSPAVLHPGALSVQDF